MGVYSATGAVLLTYLILAWFLGSWLHLKSPDIWILRGGLAFLGLLGAGAFLWFYKQSHPGATAGGGEASADTADIDLLVHDAVRKLQSSPVGRGATLGKVPLVFLIGEAGSTKTSTIVASSLDPELLAGQVYQDNQVVPTRAANIWYARQAIFVDTAGGLLAQPSKWARLVRLTQPGRVSSAMQKGTQAPRAAIVCFDCARFMEQRASETTQSAARELGARLQQVSQLLGITFPVYVLFTKVDRVSGFPEYVRNLSKEEASQVLGVTLPVRTATTGVYAEEESKRLEKAFDEIFYSLADKRMDFLAREYEGDKRPSVYEFPREFGKIRKLLVNFLIDLARPSQLQVSPFLRGFYFTGVRPVVEQDVAVAAQNVYAEPDAGSSAGATRIFSAGQLRAPQAAPAAPRAGGSRIVPQWVFLGQFFNNVLLKDQVAFSTSGMSTRVSLLRRVALITLSALSLLFLIFFFISFLENRSLENEVSEAARQAPVAHLADKQVPTQQDLQRLERLRQSVARLAVYDREGPPWHMRWGLYIGDQLYPDARHTYFDRFAGLMFNQTQGTLLASLRSLPDKPGNDPFEKTYNQLKAYLITTNEWKRSTADFLAPVLMTNWAGHDSPPDITDLARLQFDFYSSELARGNPYSSQNDARTIAKARLYLSQFGALERIYRSLLADAGKRYPYLNFNDAFKESASIVLCRVPVPGAFSADGFKFMKDALRQPTHYTSEDWVLGPATAAQLDEATLQQKLSDMYSKDYTEHWRAALHACSVVPYANIPDAVSKLDRLTMATSPLLELFWFVSTNTSVEQPNVTAAFQPSQTVVPPGPPGGYINPQNKPYVDGLTKLQGQVDLCSKAPPSEADTCPGLPQVMLDANVAVKSMSSGFRLAADNDDRVMNDVVRLLKEPIDNLDKAKGSGAKDRLNAGAKLLCGAFEAVSRKYPFNPNSNDDLPIEALNGLLAPKTGQLWQFYDSNKLSTLLIRTGTGFAANPAADIKLTPEFVRFFDRAARFSDALYGQGASPTPKFAYTFRELPSNVEGLSLKIGSETLSGTGQQKTFTWTGSGNETVEVTSRSQGNLETELGPYAVFRYVQNAHGSDPDLEWRIETNGKVQMLPNGKIKSFHYQLQVNGLNPMRPWELNLRPCPSTAAK